MGDVIDFRPKAKHVRRNDGSVTIHISRDGGVTWTEAPCGELEADWPYGQFEWTGSDTFRAVIAADTTESSRD